MELQCKIPCCFIPVVAKCTRERRENTIEGERRDVWLFATGDFAMEEEEECLVSEEEQHERGNLASPVNFLVQFLVLETCF